MTDHAPVRRKICSLAIAASLGLVTACRTGTEDIQGWANTQQGPTKIVAVMTHDKYPDDLRIEAAMTLVRMKPRSGRRLGIDELVIGLGSLPTASRSRLLGGMLPLLEREIRRPPPPEADATGARAADPTFPYKDAAFALLTSNGSALLANPQDRQRLRAALCDWVVADFSARMDDTSQTYGMAQLLTELGAEGVRRLPALIAPEARKTGSIAGFIAELGDAPTRLDASQRLVDVAREVDSDAWLKRKAPSLKQANQTSGQQVDGARFEAQLALYQEEELLRVLGSLKQIGQAPAVDYLLTLAEDKHHGDKRREAALAALEGHIDPKNTTRAERLLALASADDTPDLVRDQALRRVGELPRELAIDHLYGLFGNSNWKVRWVAAELALKMSTIQHLPEFMGKLGKVRNMAITEPIRYGQLLAALPGGPPARDLLAAFAAPQQPSAVRLTALGYYLARGTRDQLALVQPYAADPTRVPACSSAAEGCVWQCEVTVTGQRAIKPVQTVGDFVEYCVKPGMLSNSAPLAEAKTAAIEGLGKQ